jgi:hypothetical protein
MEALKQMDRYFTLVVRVPDGDETVQRGIDFLRPYITAFSVEDEISVLELIEEHEDFPEYIAEEAREKARKNIKRTALEKTNLLGNSHG